MLDALQRIRLVWAAFTAALKQADPCWAGVCARSCLCLRSVQLIVGLAAAARFKQVGEQMKVKLWSGCKGILQSKTVEGIFHDERDEESRAAARQAVR